eukprot:CAMPEP_0204367808 /NCGR_PEP_ID=MMETSP0469-20131031/43722_1 /ASSEMBLY_ACC=CAM_ASM_000384 /TAXON_ID=2969 /ORGANISM="Oxyrrhis marina" /LENGTH=71 /DNA_ID=CAMNT_0051357277 /DNA_START=231 /DNA_END=446 /DNA_ORIENTATION=+
MSMSSTASFRACWLATMSSSFMVALGEVDDSSFFLICQAAFLSLCFAQAPECLSTQPSWITHAVMLSSLPL